MGRIKGRKPEETRSAVLEAATEAFAHRGFANATLGHIAEKAGVTAATLPYHFGDKQGLYDAVVDAIYTELFKLGATIQARTTFEEVLRDVYRWAEDNRDSIRVLLRAIIETGGIDTQVRELKMGPSLDFLARAMAQRFEVAPLAARQTVVALTHLVMRFVTNTVEDNALALGATGAEDCRERIISLLSRVGRHLMGLPPIDAA